MEKQVILLAGLHKTATTSIQATCFKHRKTLAEAGFFYPTVSVAGAQDSNHTFFLKETFRDQPNRIGLAGQLSLGDNVTGQKERRQDALAAALAKQRNKMLFAAEGVSVFSESELRSMKEWFAAQGFALRVICHVRHVSSWVQSMVAQRVVGIAALTIREALNEFVAAGGVVRPRVEALRRAFPDAEFYSHERAVRHPGGPAGFFFDAIGFDGGPQLDAVRANEGRSDIGTRVVSLINEKFGRASWLGSLDDLEQHLKGRGMRMMRGLPGTKFALRRDEAEPILGMLRAENDWLRETFGQDFHDSRLEFDVEPVQWTPETVAKLNASLGHCLPEVQAWIAENSRRLGLWDAAANQ